MRLVFTELNNTGLENKRCEVFSAISVMSNSLRPHGPQPPRLLCPWDSPGKNTGVGCHFLLWGIFPTQRSNPRLLHWQADSLPLSRQDLGNSHKSPFLMHHLCVPDIHYGVTLNDSQFLISNQHKIAWVSGVSVVHEPRLVTD